MNEWKDLLKAIGEGGETPEEVERRLIESGHFSLDDSFITGEHSDLRAKEALKKQFMPFANEYKRVLNLIRVGVVPEEWDELGTALKSIESVINKYYMEYSR
jgi:hypothetical protein